MNLSRSLKPVVLILLVVGLSAVGYLTRGMWSPRDVPAGSAMPPSSATSTPSNKIIVGDQAQKNLKLTAKPLKADVFWKSITVPGSVVDRPGVSDREVVAPATGIVSDVYHTPGDTVRVGDVLFSLKLSSDTVHEAQTELLKSTQNIEVAQEKLKRLVAVAETIARARVIEAENEIKRLETAAKSHRERLLQRGLTSDDIKRVEKGEMISELPVIVPAKTTVRKELDLSSDPGSRSAIATAAPTEFELQELKVDAGQHVEAGQTLCLLANHQLLAIEGRAFRDETPLLERSVKEGWPVDVDFQESTAADWPAINQTLMIRQIVNIVDPATRTFAFYLPLENQSKQIKHQAGMRRLWRFRPGQKLWLNVRVEKLDNVFVLPADAVVREGDGQAFVFTQNVNTFQRKGVHVLFQDRERTVIANDGSLPTYRKKGEVWTIPAVVQIAAAQLNRMMKTGTSGAAPKGYHIHADGSLHKNEDEGK